MATQDEPAVSPRRAGWRTLVRILRGAARVRARDLGVGIDNHHVIALSHAKLREVLAKHGRLQPY